MKMSPLMILGAMLSLSAHAEPQCKAVIFEKANFLGLGATTYHALTIEDSVSRAKETIEFADREEDVKSGHQSCIARADRDRVGNACNAILKATRCDAIEPRARDKIMNVGDTGFGGPLWQTDSTLAGFLHLDAVEGEAKTYIDPSDIGPLGYQKYYSECHKRRVEIAKAVGERMKASIARERMSRQTPPSSKNDNLNFNTMDKF